MKLKIPDPSRLIVGAIFRERARFDRAVARMEETAGPVQGFSHPLRFDFTTYYEKEMGPGLTRIFAVFCDLIPFQQLVEIKLAAIRVEHELCDPSGSRTVNLDPGCISASNLVLATTKDYSHRLYLGKGIYGDVHLMFKKNSIECMPWTYPDFRCDPYQRFLLETRKTYLHLLREMAQSRSGPHAMNRGAAPQE